MPEIVTVPDPSLGGPRYEDPTVYHRGGPRPGGFSERITQGPP
jgi:hypothetical protein